MCAGIEAATVAWHPLGWEPVAFSEIDPFPCAVLKHHYPDVPNLGNMETITDEQLEGLGPVDLLVGGTPCQSFSVAGLRGGMADSRGNLAFRFLEIAGRLGARWVVWENVPGVLSSNGGWDFGSFLGGLAELGYGFAYRVLDAQYFGVAQRRRRVFVVGCLGDWRRAAAVLFERASLRRDSAPSREEGARVAATLTRGAESSGKGGYAGRRQEDDVNVVTALTALTGTGFGACGADDNQAQGGHLVATSTGDTAHCLNAGGMGRQDYETETLVVNARQDAIHGRDKLLPLDAKHTGHAVLPFDTTNVTSGENRANPKAGDPCHPLAAGAHAPAVAGVTIHGTDKTARVASMTDVAGSLRTKPPGSVENSSTTGALHAGAVRRLTPVECARLQGFSDDYLDIEYRGKPAKDGPKYKALGNSMATPVMRWIGERIAQVEAL